MSVESFFDSTVRLYTFDETAVWKQRIADDLIKRAPRDGSDGAEWSSNEVLALKRAFTPLSRSPGALERALAKVEAKSTTEPIRRGRGADNDE